MNDRRSRSADQDGPQPYSLHSPRVAKRSQPSCRVQGQRHERHDSENSQQQSAGPDVGAEKQQSQENSWRQDQSFRHRHEDKRLDGQSGRPRHAPCVAQNLCGRCGIQSGPRGRFGLDAPHTTSPLRPIVEPHRNE